MLDRLTTATRHGLPIALRPVRLDDAARIQQACSDPETVRWLGGDVINERYGLDDARRFVEIAHERMAAGTHMSWGIAGAARDELLGHISLVGLHGELTDTAALGYWAHPAARGTGVTTAAARAVVAEAFAGGGLRRLTLRHAVGNVASQRVAEAAGFVRTGRSRLSDVLGDGTFSDEHTYDLLATDL